MQTAKLLLVEDDKNQSFLISTHLNSSGLQCDLAMDGEEALRLFEENTYSLCIIDIMLPKLDGLSLAKKIGSINKSTPFIFLTARNLKSDKMSGYENGCEDYITKPFDIDLLVYKINVVLKRSNGATPKSTHEMMVCDLILNTLEKTLSYKNQSYTLTTKETSLIRLIFEKFDEVVSRRELMIETWGNDDFFTSKSLDVHLTRIRKFLHKSDSLRLMNIHGVGYKLIKNKSTNE
jgi:DNA-binding response OmpR family regulator